MAPEWRPFSKFKICSLQRGAGPLDAGAGLRKQFIRGRVGHAEVWAAAKYRTLHRGDASGFQQICHEVSIGFDHLADIEY